PRQGRRDSAPGPRSDRIAFSSVDRIKPQTRRAMPRNSPQTPAIPSRTTPHAPHPAPLPARTTIEDRRLPKFRPPFWGWILRETAILDEVGVVGEVGVEEVPEEAAGDPWGGQTRGVGRNWRFSAGSAISARNGLAG